MRKWGLSIAALLVVSAVPAAGQAATTDEAKPVPQIGLYSTAPSLQGTFDAEGYDAWYFESKTLISTASHLLLDAPWGVSLTMFANDKDLKAGVTYARYLEISGQTLRFPLNWSGKQYLLIQGVPGESYSVPVRPSQLPPIRPGAMSTTKKNAASLLVRYKSGVLMSQASDVNASSAESVDDALAIQSLSFDSLAQAAVAKRKLEQSKNVAYVEWNGQVKAFGTDGAGRYQWSLYNAGGSGGVKGADIGQNGLVKRVADKKRATTLVAVVDTGINASLADFAGRVRSDLGYDFVSRDADETDDNGHGTHVAGIIAATSGNTYGMRGINAKANIIPVKVLDKDGMGTYDGVAKGIIHAANKGAKVINLSLGGPATSQVIEDALAYATRKGALIVVASGNDGKGTLNYPARSKYAFSVGATNRLDQVAPFSTYGTGLDLTAPGVDIASYVHDGEIAYYSGTSMATPHVAAVASVLYGLKPTLTAKQVESLLERSAKDLGTKGYDTRYGHGRLNGDKAVLLLK
ncbi:S8 family peptidase [Exiguobacterium flavidum]|uniref:S8 family peptidase n=1 Tax=Exiguobacterium flavidum TaxID=2184695 RepID=UPI000DF76937|nr:S8 family peptidase [Exiguobacterium flavidum]